MKLHAVVKKYITHRRLLGESMQTCERILKAFVRSAGQKKNLAQIKADQVNKFLAGKGSVTTYWHGKHQALRGFYRYVISRGYAKTSPVPTATPKRPQCFIPYIYSTKEVRILLDACFTYQKRPGLLEPSAVRTLLLLLYGAGLRIREALRLTLADVNLDQGLITIRETKFRKNRLVPLGAQLTEVLLQYAQQRQQQGHSQNSEAPFFDYRNGKPIGQHAIENAFLRIRKHAGIYRSDGARFQPRLHDFRHTAAVHRLEMWYRKGADVQRLLPALSVYLGHVCLDATSTYLTMTPMLLREAGRRFERYAFKEVCHD